jgi:hypothetical protein
MFKSIEIVTDTVEDLSMYFVSNTKLGNQKNAKLFIEYVEGYQEYEGLEGDKMKTFEEYFPRAFRRINRMLNRLGPTK